MFKRWIIEKWQFYAEKIAYLVDLFKWSAKKNPNWALSSRVGNLGSGLILENIGVNHWETNWMFSRIIPDPRIFTTPLKIAWFGFLLGIYLNQFCYVFGGKISKSLTFSGTKNSSEICHVNSYTAGLQIFFSRLVGRSDPWNKKRWVIFWNNGPEHIKLTTVDIWEVYFTYTLTQTLVCIYVYWLLIIQ